MDMLDYGSKGRAEDTRIYHLHLQTWEMGGNLDTESDHVGFVKARQLLEQAKAKGEIGESAYEAVKAKLDAVIEAVAAAKPLVEALREATEAAVDGLGREYSD